MRWSGPASNRIAGVSGPAFPPSISPETSSSMAWDPAQYLKFAGPRLRPALDLLQRVDIEAPGSVYDLGAGAGNVTRLIAARWPQARIVGFVWSAEMLAKAAAENPGIEWQQADLVSWWPSRPADIIYSTAALHENKDH